MSIYDSILKDLKAGKALMLDVKETIDTEDFDRFRIVTPVSCEYSFIGISGFDFHTSCFVGLLKEDLTPKEIVSRMKDFDQRRKYIILEYWVI